MITTSENHVLSTRSPLLLPAKINNSSCQFYVFTGSAARAARGRGGECRAHKRKWGYSRSIRAKVRNIIRSNKLFNCHLWVVVRLVTAWMVANSCTQRRLRQLAQGFLSVSCVIRVLYFYLWSTQNSITLPITMRSKTFVMLCASVAKLRVRAPLGEWSRPLVL
jgi:hypothetical protein